MIVTCVAAGEKSFNSEVLESQSSAENLRQSMQKYLHNKHQHLVKVSEQLLVKKPYLGHGGSSLAPGATYESSSQHFRSLEDLNSLGQQVSNSHKCRKYNIEAVHVLSITTRSWQVQKKWSYRSALM